jgi:hypothetical protein
MESVASLYFSCQIFYLSSFADCALLPANRTARGVANGGRFVYRGQNQQRHIRFFNKSVSQKSRKKLTINHNSLKNNGICAAAVL